MRVLLGGVKVWRRIKARGFREGLRPACRWALRFDQTQIGKRAAISSLAPRFIARTPVCVPAQKPAPAPRRVSSPRVQPIWLATQEIKKSRNQAFFATVLIACSARSVCAIGFFVLNWWFFGHNACAPGSAPVRALRKPGAHASRRTARDTVKMPHSSMRCAILRKPASSTNWSSSACVRRRMTQASPCR